MRLKRLRQLRLEKGLTQTALAKLLGISKSAISTEELATAEAVFVALINMIQK